MYFKIRDMYGIGVDGFYRKQIVIWGITIPKWNKSHENWKSFTFFFFFFLIPPHKGAESRHNFTLHICILQHVKQSDSVSTMSQALPCMINCHFLILDLLIQWTCSLGKLEAVEENCLHLPVQGKPRWTVAAFLLGRREVSGKFTAWMSLWY